MKLYCITDWIVEVVLALSYPFTFLLKPIITYHKSEHFSRTRGTIVIVEGWLHDNPLHIQWVNFLKRQGFRVEVVTVPFNRYTFHEGAQILGAFLKEHSIASCTLVGISTGALVCRMFLEQYNGWQRVQYFISIGAIFNGSPLAVVVFFLNHGSALLPHSESISELSKLPTTHPDRTYCIRAYIDEYASPKSSVLIGSHEIVISVCGHNRLHLITRKTYETVARIAGTAV